MYTWIARRTEDDPRGRTRRKLSANARRIAVAEVEEEVGGGYWHQGSFHIKCC